MAKKHTKMIPDLTEKPCRFGKIANNLEHHGKDYVTAFTIPVSGLMLLASELNAFLRDRYTYRSWYDTSKPGAAEPMGWWNGESFKLSVTYEADELVVVVSGNQEIKFESEGDPKEDDYRAACRISDLVLTPQAGGMTELAFKLYVLPGLNKKNLLLQEHQHREVKVSWKDGRAIEKAKRQPELPMGQGGADPESSAAAVLGDQPAAH